MITIVIVGGGYAGVICANRLRSSLSHVEAASVRIRLVNPEEHFYERIRFHEVAAGTRDTAAIPLVDMLHPDVQLTIGTAVQIDPAKRVVDVREASGGLSTHPYDKLVYAVGSGDSTDRVRGAREFTYAIADPHSATAAAGAIAAAGTGQRVVVVGGGFTGVETAAEVAEQNPKLRVTLATSGPLVSPMRARARRSITKRLHRLGVEIEDRSFVSSVTQGALHFVDESTMEFDVCLWTAGFSVPDLARDSGLACDEVGRLRVDEHLRSIDAPDVLGAGDAVRLPEQYGHHLRMGCAAALPLGGAAADVLLALLRRRSLPIASVGFLVQCISIGRRDGYVQFVKSNDTATPFALSGSPGARFKEMICAMTVDGPRKERSKPGAYWAPKGPKPLPHRELTSA
ncbi:FAD-dependent oxidoreductase [Conyzicola nivalis]|uniref:NADH dehydrogenase n=1 Tax=Conyzicola nivalis TaxID=1477021 RepID=A0A916SI96_9MICO|nr:FAD-dependent oxidoreductase [Conyzicola nivalis]GGB00466.1 NADH dehydrogenase [Conyzicola nivalis]